MGYCTASDIQNEFRGLDIGADTVLTSAKVDEFIDQASAEIDSRLGSKFVTPITGTNSLKLMKTACTWLVAERVRSILEVKLKAPDTGQVVRNGNTAKDARQMLSDFMDGTAVLPDATLVNSGGGIQSRNVSHNQRHQFHRNRDQW